MERRWTSSPDCWVTWEDIYSAVNGWVFQKWRTTMATSTCFRVLPRLGRLQLCWKLFICMIQIYDHSINWVIYWLFNQLHSFIQWMNLNVSSVNTATSMTWLTMHSSKNSVSLKTTSTLNQSMISFMRNDHLLIWLRFLIKDSMMNPASSVLRSSILQTRSAANSKEFMNTTRCTSLCPKVSSRI